MGRRYLSHSIRACLDSMRDDEEFRAFAENIINPPRGMGVMKATPDELREIRDRLARMNRKKG